MGQRFVPNVHPRTNRHTVSQRVKANVETDHLYATLTAVLNELQATGDISVTGKNYIQQTFYDNTQQTINLNNNECGSTMTGTQQDITTSYYKASIATWVSPSKAPVSISLRTHTNQSRPIPSTESERAPPTKSPADHKIYNVHNFPQQASARTWKN